MYFLEDDGGRKQYFKGITGDCVTRAIAIATQQDYKEVYDALFREMNECKVRGTSTSPRDGVSRRIYDYYLRTRGWVWKPTMSIGSGCKVHLRQLELPQDRRLIVRLSKHLTTVINGVIHDIYDPSRNGTRCVYGYYTKE